MNTLSTKLTRLSSSAPTSAEPKLSTVKPRTSALVISSISALITNVKRPSVSRLIGRVSSRTIGRTSAFRMPSTSAATNVAAMPSAWIPETMTLTSHSAKALSAQRSRGAKGLHADRRPRRADVLMPAEGRGLFDRHPGTHARRQHRVSIFGALMLEELPRRHRHHARRDALGTELLIRLETQRDLAAGRQQQDVGRAAARLGQDVRSLANPARRP